MTAEASTIRFNGGIFFAHNLLLIDFEQKDLGQKNKT
jgi:hypothetical protein